MKKIRIVLFGLLLLVLAACSADANEELDTIVFADAKWDSLQVHNHIAATIIEAGFGYDTEVKVGSTAATVQALRQGDIHVYMEVWIQNIEELYNKAIDSGDIKKISTNFDDTDQGLYVPRYVIEGDADRGIEPMAPDLRTVADLKKYPEVFEDPEQPGRGRVINAPSGWVVDEDINAKFDLYELDETMNNFMPGSDAAIVTSLASAYEKGNAWVGYYWAPTAVTAKYDLVLLEEPPYEEEEWNETRGTAFPPNEVAIAVNKDLPNQAPEVIEFLEQYKTSSQLTEDALTYLEENDTTTEAAAIWWMKEYEDVWTEWLSDEIAEKVKASLKSEEK